NVGVVSGPSPIGIGPVLVNTVHGKTMEFKNRCHPGTVPFGEIVVHGHQMGAFARQGVQIEWEGSHQGLTFPCLHFRYFSLMKSNTAYQLYIVMNHVPSDLFSGSIP